MCLPVAQRIPRRFWVLERALAGEIVVKSARPGTDSLNTASRSVAMCGTRPGIILTAA